VAVAVDKRFGSGPQTINISPRTVLIPNSRLVVGFTGLEGDVQSLASELSTLIAEKKGRHLGFGFGPDSPNDGYSSAGEIGPKSMSMLLSHILYGRRGSPYYVQPIVVGLEKRVVKRKRITDVLIDDDNGNCNDGVYVGSDGNRNPELVKKEQKKGPNSLRFEYLPFLCAQDVIGARSTSSSFVCSGVASKSLYGTAEAMWKPDLSPNELVQVCGQAFLSALERDCLSGYGAIIYLLVGGEGIIEIDLACRND